MTFQALYLFSMAAGVVSYLVLVGFSLVNLRRGITGKALLLAAVVSLLYIVALGLMGETTLSLALACAVQYAWIILLIRAVGFELAGLADPRMRPLLYLFASTSALVIFGIIYPLFLLGRFLGSGPVALMPSLITEVLLSVCGLVALEQLVRNTREDLRWRLRYLNIGLGLIFSFNLLNGAFGLLYGVHQPELQVLQPAILAIAAPFVIIASLRNRDNKLRLNVSREFAFRTGVLISAGGLLMLIGLAGYYAKLFGGDLATALVVLVGTLICVGGLVLVGSSQAQSWLKRFIARHLYESKHDYRAVWEEISSRLTEPSVDYSLRQQAIRSFLDVLDTPGGALWRLTEAGALVPEARLQADWADAIPPDLTKSLRVFFDERDWIIDLEASPDDFPHELAAGLTAELPGARFLVPLMVQGQLFGIVVTRQPHNPSRLDWEDYDVLRLISRQTAGLLAFEHAAEVLSDSQQLNTFNRLSAFVVHDLKTVSAQLSLLLENAERHKSNPAFIDDMLATVGNSVTRMQRLLDQFRKQSPVSTVPVDLNELIEQTLCAFSERRPRPVLIGKRENLLVQADPARLGSVIGHVVENAIEATPECGEVCLSVHRDGPWAEITVADTGSGMDSNFVDAELFAPFESTKGLAGMGIGAYQAREYVRALGGDVGVDSALGRGTRFTMRIPCEETT